MRAASDRRSVHSGFTLIEIVLVTVITMLIVFLSVPSLEGVLADKRLRRSYDSFNDLVRQAQEKSVTEHRAYLIIWGRKGVFLQPEIFGKGEEEKPTAIFPVKRNNSLKLLLPAALRKDPPGQWIFWPSGICEPAIVEFTGPEGDWRANYPPLTARPELLNYVAR
jgi:type II secretory pathway pseudopilin PulG